MKQNAVILAARPAPLFFSQRGKALSRRLRITTWQTHYWTKKINKPGKGSQACKETHALRQRGKKSMRPKTRLSPCLAVSKISRPPSVVASSTQSSARMSGHRAGKGRMSFPCVMSSPSRNP
jgi:hypothetical protein